MEPQELEPDFSACSLYKTLHTQQKKLLSTYAVTGNVSVAARAAKVSRQAHYHWLAADPAYAEAARHAEEEAADLLEAEARRRAASGVRRPVLYKGQQVKINDPETGKAEPLWECVYSDSLMLALLKASRPDKFAERTKNENSNDTRLKVDEDEADLDNLTVDELEQYLVLTRKAKGPKKADGGADADVPREQGPSPARPQEP